MNNNDLKHKIISAMADHNLTEWMIAEKIGVTASAVSGWIMGAKPRAAKLKKLNDFLDSLHSGKASETPAPSVKPGDWLHVGRIDVYVIAPAKVHRNNLLVAYLRNATEAVHDVIEWRGDHWDFVFDEPLGQKLDNAWISTLSKGAEKIISS